MSKSKIIKTVTHSVWLICLLCLGYVINVAFVDHSARKVEQVTVNVMGDDQELIYLVQKLGINEDLQALYRERFLGQEINHLSLTSIEDEVSQHTLVSDVTAYIDKFGDLIILLKPRMPIARIFQNEGQNFYIDLDGVKVEVSPHFSMRTLVVTGHVPSDWHEEISAGDGLPSSIHNIAMAIDKDDFLSSYLDQVHINADASFSIIPKFGSFEIELSNAENLDIRLSNLKVFLQEIARRGKWKTYSKVNIDINNQVIATKSPQ